VKKLILGLVFVLAASNVFAEELVLFDKNNSANVYLIKQSLVRENQTVRSIWVKYQYTKKGSIVLKEDIKAKRMPSFSKVKYGFDCGNKQHKVFIATIYESDGSVIQNLKDGAVEEVIPGSVGEAIRNFTCSYDIEKDRVSEAI